MKAPQHCEDELCCDPMGFSGLYRKECAFIMLQRRQERISFRSDTGVWGLLAQTFITYLVLRDPVVLAIL